MEYDLIEYTSLMKSDLDPHGFSHLPFNRMTNTLVNLQYLDVVRSYDLFLCTSVVYT